MTTLFEDRQRAAEYGYVHAEELRFLAVREGLESVARWAAETLGASPEAGADYAAALVGRLIGGADGVALVAQVRNDLEAGRHLDCADEVQTRFAQAVALASDRQHGGPKVRHGSSVGRAAKPTPHPMASGAGQCEARVILWRCGV